MAIANRHLARILVVLVTALCIASLTHPGTAMAVTAGEVSEDAPVNESAPWYYADSIVESASDIQPDDLMSATKADFDLLQPFGSLGNWFARTMYDLLAGGTNVLSSAADQFISQISTGELFGDAFGAGSAYRDAYLIVVRVAENVIVPVANGFLGLSFVFSLMSFGREAGMGGRHGTDLFASYIWLAAKYVLLSSCISHSVDLMLGIFGIVNEVGRGMQALGGLGALTMTGFSDSFMAICRSLTYAQGAGAAVVILLFALVCLGAAALTAIYTQVVVVLRIFEVCILMAFSGFAFVMLGHQGTREAGIRYIKRFGSVCVQALVILLVVGLGSVFMSVSIGLFANAGGTDLVSMLMNVVGPLVSCIAIFLMVKMSRDVANAIVGL